jgi:hypothetical protein
MTLFTIIIFSVHLHNNTHYNLINTKKQFIYNFFNGKKATYEESQVSKHLLQLFQFYQHASLLKDNGQGHCGEFTALTATIFMDPETRSKLNIKTLNAISVHFKNGSNHMFLIINANIPKSITSTTSSVQLLLKNSPDAFICDPWNTKMPILSQKELDQLHMMKDNLLIEIEPIPMDINLDNLPPSTKKFFIEHFREDAGVIPKKYLTTFFPTNPSKNPSQNLSSDLPKIDKDYNVYRKGTSIN